VLGQHNAEVLRELLGFSDETIAALKQRGVFD
jgi:crotonobetainyl-CoA:carnitine CoA-transferase CaiB-like acyl-CoA transferase